MAIHAEAVEVLVDEGKFQPQVAMAIVKAIEVTMTLSQLVTVNILDARLSELRHELKTDIEGVRTDLERVRADVIRWVFLAMLGNVALSAGISEVQKFLSNL